jgi:hypothetical protein
VKRTVKTLLSNHLDKKYIISTEIAIILAINKVIKALLFLKKYTR